MGEGVAVYRAMFHPPNAPAGKKFAVNRAIAFLNAPRDAAPLAAFRIVFGGLMAFEAFASYLHKIPDRYSPDLFHFTYPGFHWVVPPPGIGIYFVIGSMGLAAFCVTIGWRYRASSLVFLLAYTYLFLIDRVAYNNHYYLIILLALLFTITRAHADASLDSARIPEAKRGWVPAWQLYIFRAQIVVVYFFGGVAKLSPDWLRREPITHWIRERAEVLALGPLLQPDFVPWLLAYGGLVFDLSIGFLLLWRRTRLIAVALVLGFHLTNAYLFSIGVFPWLGIGATVLFLDAGTVRRALSRLGYARSAVELPLATSTSRAKWPLAFCAVYLLVQCLVPLRHWCYAGDVNWTEEGHDFSWHMKLRDKEGVARFRILDRGTGTSIVLEEADLANELTLKQIRDVSCKPELMAHYARHLREVYTAKGYRDPAVFAETLVSLNGRPYLPLVNPHVDLAAVEHSPWRAAAWIVPLDPAAEPGAYPPAPAGFDIQEVPRDK